MAAPRSAGATAFHHLGHRRQPGRLLRGGRCPVRDQHAGYTGPSETIDDRSGRGTGPDERDDGAGRIVTGCSQRIDKAVAVGAQSARCPVGEDHRVHRPQGSRGWVEGVDRLRDHDLVRHGHRETAEPPAAGRRHKTRPIFRGDVLGHHFPVESSSGEGSVVDRWRQRMRHRVADNRYPLTRADHGSTPARLAAAMFSWCCSKVTAKACPPSKSAST